MIRLLLCVLLSAGLIGCEPRPPDTGLSPNHPANASSQSGRPIGAPASLRPELQTVRPQLPGQQQPSVQPRSQKPASGGGSHHQH